MRTFVIWVSGLLACALIGGYLGSIFDIARPTARYPNGNAYIGMIVGVLAFTCARLWFAEKPK